MGEACDWATLAAELAGDAEAQACAASPPRLTSPARLGWWSNGSEAIWEEGYYSCPAQLVRPSEQVL